MLYVYSEKGNGNDSGTIDYIVDSFRDKKSLYSTRFIFQMPFFLFLYSLCGYLNFLKIDASRRLVPL